MLTQSLDILVANLKKEEEEDNYSTVLGTFGNSNEESQSTDPHFPFLHSAACGAGAKPFPSAQPEASMDQETVGNIVLLVIVTLISVIQNGFFANKVEHESKIQNGRSFQRTGTLAFERVYTANQNCVDAYPTFLAVLWSAGLLCSQVPAAFAGLMYLFVRQKYFVGYLGERTQSTPGYIFGKRIILFLFLMSVAGIFNYYLILFFGSDFENYIKTITTTISPLLLIP